LVADAQGRAKSKAALIRELAAKARVKVLVTTHHSPAMDKPGVRERVMTDIGPALPAISQPRAAC
jgi:hypothetical protein